MLEARIGTYRSKWVSDTEYVRSPNNMQIPAQRLPVVTFLVGLMLIGGIAFYFWPIVIDYCEMRRVRQPLALWATPRPLTDTAVSSVPGTTLSCYGYRFEVPWQAVVRQVNEGRWTEAQFRGGQRVRFINPEYANGDTHLGHPDALEDAAFGSNIPGSKYEHFKAIISMSPTQLSPFRSRRSIARDRAYLVLKGLWFEHNPGRPDIFSIEAPHYRGFESSDLAYGRQEVGLTLFDAAEHEFGFSISVARDSTAKLTQAEINRVIQSLQPIR